MTCPDSPLFWAKAYEFDENTGALTVVIEGPGRFRYDASGTFIDAANFDLACLRCGQVERVLTAAEEMLRRPNLDAQLAHSILASAQRLVRHRPTSMAVAWRQRGKSRDVRTSSSVTTQTSWRPLTRH